MTNVPVEQPRRASPWSRRVFAGIIIVGCLALGWRYGDDHMRLAICVSGACGGFLLHILGPTMDTRSLTNFVRYVRGKQDD